MFGTYIGKIMLLLQYIEAQRQIEAQSTGSKTTPYLSSFVRGSCNVNFMLLAEPRSENWICQYGRPSFVKWLIWRARYPLIGRVYEQSGTLTFVF